MGHLDHGRRRMRQSDHGSDIELLNSQLTFVSLSAHCFPGYDHRDILHHPPTHGHEVFPENESALYFHSDSWPGVHPCR